MKQLLKKGYIHHPLVAAVIAFILGLAAAYVWIHYGTQFWNPFCGT